MLRHSLVSYDAKQKFLKPALSHLLWERLELSPRSNLKMCVASRMCLRRSSAEGVEQPPGPRSRGAEATRTTCGLEGMSEHKPPAKPSKVRGQTVLWFQGPWATTAFWDKAPAVPSEHRSLAAHLRCLSQPKDSGIS